MLRIYLLETKYEFLKLLRLPAYALPTIAFPIFFYLFFGIGFAGKNVGGVTMASYLIATYGAFGIIGAALFGFGVTVAIERGQGWIEAKRITPMPFRAYFIAKTAMALIFSAVIVLGLFTVGTTIGGVRMPVGQALALFGVLMAGSITFCALGLAIGCVVKPSAAAPIVNLVYLPLAFLSGLWVPIAFLPKAIQTFAVFLPPFHFSQLALKTIGADRGGSVVVHVVAMLLATAIFASIAYAGFRRGETA